MCVVNACILHYFWSSSLISADIMETKHINIEMKIFFSLLSVVVWAISIRLLCRQQIRNGPSNTLATTTIISSAAAIDKKESRREEKKTRTEQNSQTVNSFTLTILISIASHLVRHCNLVRLSAVSRNEKHAHVMNLRSLLYRSKVSETAIWQRHWWENKQNRNWFVKLKWSTFLTAPIKEPINEI